MEDDKKTNMGQHDPYNALRRKQKSDIRPTEIPINSDTETTNRQSTAADTALSAEQTAVTTPTPAKTDTDDINNFNYSGKGKSSSSKQQGVLSGNSTLKKAAPIIGILLLVALPLIAIGSLLAMPFHLLENIKNGFNSLFPALASSSKESYRTMLTANAESGYAKIGDDGCGDFSSTGNIQYNLCPDGANDPDIQAYYREKALENSTLAANNPSLAAPYDGQVFKYIDRNGGIHMIDKDNFDTWWEDIGFNEAITHSSLAWTGSFAGWFDDATQKLMQTLQTTRNAFQDYYEDINDQIKSEEAYREIIEAINDKGKTTMTHTSREKLVLFSGGCENPQQKGLARKKELTDLSNASLLDMAVHDTSGNCTTTDPPPEIANDLCSKVFDLFGNYLYHECPMTVWYDTTTETVVSEALSKAREKVDGLLPEMVNTFYNGSSDSGGNRNQCSTFYGLSYFSAITAATRLQQAADFATKALESIDKTRAGLGSESPTHQLSQHLTNQNTYEYLPIGSTETVSSSTNRPGLNASGLSWISTNSAVDLTDLNIQKLSLEGVMAGYVLDVGTFLSCNLATFLGDTLYGIFATIVGLTDHIFSDTNTQWLFLNRQAVRDELLDDAITRAAYGLIFNPCTEPGGEDVGNCIALGSHYYLSKNHQLSGGSPADRAKLAQFTNEQRQVIARQAERERTNRSPFDTSSQYTFLGSIISHITPYATTLTNSSMFTSISSIVSSSINSLLPSANAVTDDVISNNIGNCQYLGSGEYEGSGINAVGDAFCIPYIISDIDPGIINMTTQAVEQKVRDLNGFEDTDDDSNPKIKTNSNFARYIVFCANRYSMFGIIDSNIINAFTEHITDGFFRSLLGLIIGKDANDALAISQNKEATLGWATGQYCVATDEDTNPNNVNYAPTSWNDETRYYQAYMLYQRINVNRGGYASNNTLAVIDNYEKANPLDNSPEGILARTAGMSTEDYAAMTSYIAYQATNKSSFGPIITTVADNPTITFRSSIAPLTDFFLDNIVPVFIVPNVTDPRSQGVTA